MKKCKSFFCFFAVIFVLLFCQRPAEAAAVSDNSIGAEESDDWIEVADFKALSRIINASIGPHTRFVRLTADITITGGENDIYYIISPEDAPINIDTGDYTIYVEGQMQIMGNVSIFGKGGDEGLLHIRKGGYADIQGGSLKAEEGYAIWQEDGSFFSASDMNNDTSPHFVYSCEGECRYPDKPVVWSSYEKENDKISYRIIPVESDFSQEVLPTELYSVWCEKGKSYEGMKQVYWEVGEDTRDSIQERKRTSVRGNFGSECDSIDKPECMLLFQNKNAAVFVKGKLTVYAEELLVLQLYFVLDNPEADNDGVYVEFSDDGKNWRRSENGEYSPQDEFGYFYEEFGDRTALPVYLCVCVEKDGRLYYSDIMMISDDNTLVIGDIQGGRGGGTPILTDTAKPGTESGNPGEEESSDIGNPQKDSSTSDTKNDVKEAAFIDEQITEAMKVETAESAAEQESVTAGRAEEQNENPEEEKEKVLSESAGIFSEYMVSGKTDGETGIITEEQREERQSEESCEEETEGSCTSLESLTEESGAFSEKAWEEEVSAEKLERVRKRQIFWGFCSVGIILAVVFGCTAFIHRHK